MNNEIGFEIEFLAGRYSGADPFRRHLPEWPPPPARLFAAMAAVAFEDADEDALNALRWLETLPPPKVFASGCDERMDATGKPPTHFVPANDMQAAKGRTKQRRPFPSVTPHLPIIQMWWQGAPPEPDMLARLRGLASQVPYIGESACPVRVAAATEKIDADCYEPTEKPDRFFRVPFAGQIDQFKTNFGRQIRTAAGLQVGYHLRKQVQEATVSQVGTSAYTEFHGFEIVSSESWSVTQTLLITTAVRMALVECAGAAGCALLHGHETDGSPLRADHVAIVPLPFVRGAYANGRMLGFAVIIPKKADATDRAAVIRALAGLRSVRLPQGQVFSVRRVYSGERRQSLRADNWVRASKTWASVTPVVLNRFPAKAESKQLAAILKSMLEHAGLPQPASMSFGPEAPVACVPHTRQFQVVRNHWRPRPYGHLWLRFEEPIRGPLIVGSRRHYGLGFMMPIDED